MSTVTPARLIVAASALFMALVVSGCASSAPVDLPADAGDTGTVEPTPGPTASAPELLDIASLDACTILTRADAETLIGTALTEPMSAATADVSSCIYPGDPNGPTAQVEIYVGPGAKQQLEIDRDQLQHPFIEVSGLGDEAWQEDGMIFARTGTTWVSIRLVSIDDPAAFTAPLQSAMTVALSRL